jgi:hypothetical protein
MELLLFIIAPFALAYFVAFGILVVLRGMRQKRRQQQEYELARARRMREQSHGVDRQL